MSESVENPIAGAGSALTRKMGPLPVWAWAAIVVAVVWGLYAYRTVTGRAKPVPAVPGAGTPDNGYSASTGSVSGSVGGVGVQSGINGTPAMQTNAQWARQAADQLIAMGDSPDAVNNALSAYVNGQTLDTGGDSIIREALTKFGNPPEGVLPVHASVNSSSPLDSLPFKDFVGYDRDPSNGAIYGVDKNGTLAWLNPDQYKALGSPSFNSVSVDGIKQPVPAPPPAAAPAPPPPPPPPPAQRYYTVQPGDSLSLIAGRYTGNVMNYPALYNANKGIIGGNPDLIQPGQRLVIPW